MYKFSLMPRGRRPGTSKFSPEEKTHLRLYLPYVFDADVERQATARKQILDVIQKPGGIAQDIYQKEVNMLKKYVNPSVVKSMDEFEDKMYAIVYPQYLDAMPREVFKPEVISRMVNPRGRQRFDAAGDKYISFRSEESMMYEKLASTLRNTLVLIARQEKDTLGLVAANREFSVPGFASNWRHDETVSLDTAPAAGSEEAQAMSETLAGPAESDPAVAYAELTKEIAVNYPDFMYAHIKDIVSDVLDHFDPSMSPEALAADAKDAVAYYAAERLPICQEVGDQPDEDFWQDPAKMQELAGNIAAAVTIATRDELQANPGGK